MRPHAAPRRTNWTRVAIYLAIAAAAFYGAWQRRTGPPDTPPAPPAGTAPQPASKPVPMPRGPEGAKPGTQPDAIEVLFAARRSNEWVEAGGVVQRLLRDDTKGSRHQRFVVRLAGGHTVLVSHNISLAPRVPLARGDSVRFRGEYEWTEQGGVVHWTHLDPDGGSPGGWIRWKDQVFR